MRGLDITEVGFTVPQDSHWGIWVGLNDLKGDHTFEWSDGTKVDYNDWEPGCPCNPPVGGRGVLLYVDTMPSNLQYQKWVDWDVGEVLRAYVCKKQTNY